MFPASASSGFELRDYLRVLRRRRLVIGGVLVLIVGAAMTAAFLQTPVYQATARILLQPRSSETLFDPETGGRNDPQRKVENEIQVLRSQPVQDSVRKRIGSAPPIRAAAIGGSDVIAIKARSTVPKQARDTADAYAAAYIEYRRTQAVDDLLAAAEQIQKRISDIQAQIAEIDRATPAAPSRPGAAPPAPAERDALIDQQAVFKQRLDELQVDVALRTGGAQLVASANLPTEPVEPRPIRTGLLATAVGLMVGVGLAFLLEYLDDSIKTKEDADRLLPEVPTLALVPAVTGWREREKAVLTSMRDPASPAAEAYRSLRTSIQFIGLDRPMNTLQVTSANAGEGKTTTLANLAVALARSGQRVMVVCCDLRRPRVHEFFWLTNKVGFTSVLLGEARLADAIQSVPGEERIKLLASGPAPPNPSELLGGRRTIDLLAAIQSESDIVLIDSAPVLPVTDAAVLSSRVDATLLVATAGATTKKELHRAYELLKQVDAPIVGMVLNGVKQDSAYGYAYQYTYQTKEPAPSRFRRQRPGRREQSIPRV